MSQTSTPRPSLHAFWTRTRLLGNLQYHTVGSLIVKCVSRVATSPLRQRFHLPQSTTTCRARTCYRPSMFVILRLSESSWAEYWQISQRKRRSQCHWLVSTAEYTNIQRISSYIQTSFPDKQMANLVSVHCFFGSSDVSR